MQHTQKTLWIGDVHLSDTPPGWRTDSYRDDVLAKLVQCMELAEEHEVDYIFFAGDIFHHRRRVSHALIADVADILRTADCRKFILPGNHDLIDNIYASATRQPVGLLARMPGVHLLRPGEVIEFERLIIRAIPYVPGMGYDEGIDRSKRLVNEKKYVVNLYHYGITDGTYNPHVHTLNTQSEEWDSDADVVFSGHIHEDLGVHRARDGALCFNLGAITRGALTQDNLERTPRVLVTEWQVKPGKPVFTAVPLQVRPAEEVFLLEEAEQKKRSEEVAEAFTEAIGVTTLAVVSVEEVIEKIRQRTDVEAAVKRAAVAALEEL